jgi:hypothetical protein
MTFDGSADLHADADLIVGGMLVDFKANQGGKPRADGTRAASLARTDIDQLLGYTLMDTPTPTACTASRSTRSGSAISPAGRSPSSAPG